jgi:endonuclease/exonuclease/phosphatase family metal-dependent hydrolase
VRYFNFIAAVVLTLLYMVGKIPPTEKFNLWFITFLIPFALAINLLLFIITAFLRKRSSIYYVITLIVGSNYLLSTIGLKYVFKSKVNIDGSFSLISYNAQILAGIPHTIPSNDPASSGASFKKWILENESDIKCFQEFRNNFADKNSDLIQAFKESGYHTSFSYDPSHTYKSMVVGILIASKFPIIKSGDIVSSENGFNRIAYADLKIKHDTVRIVNVHLESMGLKQYHPGYASGFESKKENAKIIFQKRKEGVFERSIQVKTLSEFINKSPHPVICAGDFNDLPYSYSYQFMRTMMRNAFEESGKGFGFTYNGKTLRALRIDNQFYSSRIEAVDFTTLNNIQFSDHFPIRGVYVLRRNSPVMQEAGIR